MKHILLIAGLLLRCVLCAHASDFYCYNDDEDQGTRICEFSDGTAKITHIIDSDHSEHSYKRGEWKIEKARVYRLRNSLACAKASDAMSDEYYASEKWFAARQVEAKACGRYR